MENKNFVLGLLLSLRLNDFEIIKFVIEEIPFDSIPKILQQIQSLDEIKILLKSLTTLLTKENQFELYLLWVKNLIKIIDLD